ncbi:hypothetical protein lerEdw1_015164, partial [Lerista edwardsae]
GAPSPRIGEDAPFLKPGEDGLMEPNQRLGCVPGRRANLQEVLSDFRESLWLEVQKLIGRGSFLGDPKKGTLVSRAPLAKSNVLSSPFDSCPFCSRHIRRNPPFSRSPRNGRRKETNRLQQLLLRGFKSGFSSEMAQSRNRRSETASVLTVTELEMASRLDDAEESGVKGLPVSEGRSRRSPPPPESAEWVSENEEEHLQPQNAEQAASSRPLLGNAGLATPHEEEEEERQQRNHAEEGAQNSDEEDIGVSRAIFQQQLPEPQNVLREQVEDSFEPPTW